MISQIRGDGFLAQQVMLGSKIHSGAVFEGFSTYMLLRSVELLTRVREFRALLLCLAVASSAGEEHTKDRKLGFNPCGISYINGGSYIAVGGSNRKATLYTKVRL